MNTQKAHETRITLKDLWEMEQLVDTSRYLLDLFTVVLSL